MKKLTTLIFILTLASSMAFAQNDASIEQVGNNGGGNQATIDQEYSEAFGVTDINTANVFQTGNANVVEQLNQFGAGNEYDVYQSGSANRVEQHPEQGKFGESVNGEIDIDQFGNGNVVWDTDQSGENNTSIIYQDGNDNFADVEGQRSTGSDGNLIDIIQDGNDLAVGTGTSTGAYQEGEGNDMDIDQTGSDNKAGTESVQGLSAAWSGVPSQEGGQGLVQLGSDNKLTIDQNNSGNTVRFVLQDGIQNTSSIMQNNMDNVADVIQTGFGNTSSITQN